MGMDVEAEIIALKQRVDALEGSFGFLTEQPKGVHRQLIAFEAETRQNFKRIDARLEKLEAGLEEARADRQAIRAEMNKRFDELPGLVGDVVREVLRGA